MAELSGSITPAQQMISSCSGAMLTSLLVTPLDVIKIRLQAQQKPIAKGSCFLYCNGLMDHLQVCPCDPNGSSTKPYRTEFWYRRPGKFNGTIDAFVKIVRSEGVMSLWSGLPPTLIMAIPSTVVYYTSYDRLKYTMGYKEDDPTTKNVPLLAGPIARFGAATLISPLEMARTKLQSEQLSYGRVGAAMSEAVRHQGVLSLWRGLGPTLLRDVPFSAIYWYGYELIKARQMALSNSPHRSLFDSFAAGAIAGTIAGVLTLPFDVIKTHRQITLGDNISQAESTSTWMSISKLYRQGGIPSLFSGLIPRIVRVAPACAIMISSYEFCKEFFHQLNTERDYPNTTSLPSGTITSTRS